MGFLKLALLIMVGSAMALASCARQDPDGESADDRAHRALVEANMNDWTSWTRHFSKYTANNLLERALYLDPPRWRTFDQPPQTIRTTSDAWTSFAPRCPAGGNSYREKLAFATMGAEVCALIAPAFPTEDPCVTAGYSTAACFGVVVPTALSRERWYRERLKVLARTPCRLLPRTVPEPPRGEASPGYVGGGRPIRPDELDSPAQKMAAFKVRAPYSIFHCAKYPDKGTWYFRLVLRNLSGEIVTIPDDYQ